MTFELLPPKALFISEPKEFDIIKALIMGKEKTTKEAIPIMAPITFALFAKEPHSIEARTIIASRSDFSLAKIT